MRIPISIKLITVTMLVLLLATIPAALQNAEQFAKVSMQREDFTNLEAATAKAKEVEFTLNSLTENIKIISQQLAKNSNSPNTNLLQQHRHILSLEIFEQDNQQLKSILKTVKNDPQNPLPGHWLPYIRQQQRFDHQRVFAGQIEIRNGSGPKRPAMFTIGLPLGKDNQGRITQIVVADIMLSVLQKIIGEASERVQFIIDSKGQLIAHKDESLLTQKTNMMRFEYIQKSLEQKSPRYQTKFYDPQKKSAYFAATVKTSFGVTVVSQISEAIIREPAQEVQRYSMYITITAIAVALTLIFLVSMNLTAPIVKLAELTNIISKGQFDVKARSLVKSQDEVGDLAIAFDHMTEGLKERDKVKNLFSKFHGSSVAENLLNNEIKVGGQKKEVIVFFSDIRGFTAFSETKAPEEVVEMLNSYFEVMVKIINQYNGVVDKFIGDAIMAVWGAPQEDPDDAKNAVRACLEMRKALVDFNFRRQQKGQETITIGMGLHAGQAISGTIGSDERMEYTVIGNTVNTASRIEAATKSFGVDILISDEVIGKIGDHFLVTLAGAAEVKGRSEPIKMYKVRGYIDKNGEEVLLETPYSQIEKSDDEKIKIAS